MTTCPDLIINDNEYCIDVLRRLFDTYQQVLSGSTARIRMGTRWSEYHPGHPGPIKELYMQIYQQCPDPAKCELPDLSQPGVRRGPPVGGIFPQPWSPATGRGWYRS